MTPSGSARASGMDAVQPPPELGPEISLDGYKAFIAESMNFMSHYNRLLSEVDEAKNRFERSEKRVRDYSSRILAGNGGEV